MIGLLKRLFCKKKKRRVYAVLIQGKPEFVREGAVDTTVVGYLFESKDDAMKHAVSLQGYESWLLYDLLGIQEIDTELPVTVAKIDYRRTDSHPTPTATFKNIEPE